MNLAWDCSHVAAKQRLAPYKVPATVEFRSELPKTMAGKVLRRALTAEP